MVLVFQVKRPDGTEAYTRDGAFKVGPDGQITTADALPLAAGLQIDPEVTMFLSPQQVRFQLRLLTAHK